MITSSGLSDPSGDPARFIDGEPSRRRERLSGRRAEGEHYHPRAVRAARSGAGNNSATIAESNGRGLFQARGTPLSINQRLEVARAHAPAAMRWQARSEYRKGCAAIGFQKIGSPLCINSARRANPHRDPRVNPISLKPVK